MANIDIVLKYLSFLRKYSCNSKVENTCVYIAKTNIVPSILEFLKRDYACYIELQKEAIWLMRNILTLQEEQLAAYLNVVDVIQKLLEGLECESNHIFKEVKKNK